MARVVGIGALILTVFGCVWLLAGILLLDLVKSDLLLIIVGSYSFLLAVFSIWQMLGGGKGEPLVSDPELSERIFKATNIALWTTVAVIILILNFLNKADWLPWIVSMIVGLHFIPLARAFQLRSYLVVAAVILLLNVVLLVLHTPLRNAYSCVGTGTILLITATYRLIWLWKNSDFPDE